LSPEIPIGKADAVVRAESNIRVIEIWQDCPNFPGVGDLGTLDIVMMR